MLKYQKFQTPISKRDVLSKKDQMSWFMQKPNEKLLSCVIILWEVIYAHFYNWDRLLDFVSVVYDLIEFIIEASLWSKDYSTLDTHPQHTRLWFNECLSHLCDCTCPNVMCMLKYLLIKPKYIFECFICFWKWFYTFVSFVFIQNAFLCFSSKTGLEGVSREARALELPAKSFVLQMHFSRVTSQVCNPWKMHVFSFIGQM